MRSKILPRNPAQSTVLFSSGKGRGRRREESIKNHACTLNLFVTNSQGRRLETKKNYSSRRATGVLVSQRKKESPQVTSARQDPSSYPELLLIWPRNEQDSLTWRLILEKLQSLLEIVHRSLWTFAFGGYDPSALLQSTESSLPWRPEKFRDSLCLAPLHGRHATCICCTAQYIACVWWWMHMKTVINPLIQYLLPTICSCNVQ